MDWLDPVLIRRGDEDGAILPYADAYGITPRVLDLVVELAKCRSTKQIKLWEQPEGMHAWREPQPSFTGS